MKKILTSLVAVAFAFALTIPSVTDAAAHTSHHSGYTVKSGDTMWKISQHYHVSLGALKKANPQVKNPTVIYVGQTIHIPSKSGKTEASNQKSEQSAPTSSNKQSSSLSQYEQQVVNLTNKERTKRGLQPLKVADNLSNMAGVKAADMRDNHYFDHNSPKYGSPFDMMSQFGISYSYAGENIAAGQRTPQDVVNSWMNSPGHRANILNKHYTYIGVGYVSGGSYGSYWVQEFIKK